MIFDWVRRELGRARSRRNADQMDELLSHVGREEPPAHTATVQGLPITEELQLVFGWYGKVTGLITSSGAITVHYENELSVRYVPVANYEGADE